MGLDRIIGTHQVEGDEYVKLPEQWGLSDQEVRVLYAVDDTYGDEISYLICLLEGFCEPSILEGNQWESDFATLKNGRLYLDDRMKNHLSANTYYVIGGNNLFEVFSERAYRKIDSFMDTKEGDETYYSSLGL